jgi:hypothetical protein
MIDLRVVATAVPAGRQDTFFGMLQWSCITTRCASGAVTSARVT